jgi:predicted ATP-grasp superfamily ATP-dependent carboligase
MSIEMNVSYIRVSFPSPECYFTIPAEWDKNALSVKHGHLYYLGHRTMLVPKDFVMGKEVIEIIDETHMDYDDVRQFLNE